MQFARFVQNKRLAAGAAVLLVIAVLFLFDSLSNAEKDGGGPAAAGDLKRAELNVLIDQWLTETEGIALSSNPQHYMNTPAVERMIRLDADYLPYIVERVVQDQSLTSFVLANVAAKLSQSKEAAAFQYETPGGFVKQWKKFEQSVPARYAAIRDKAGAADGKEEAIHDAVDLGVLVVPLIMEDIEAGNAALAPAITRLLPGDNTPDSTSVKAWKKWVKGAGVKYEVLRGNPDDAE